MRRAAISAGLVLFLTVFMTQPLGAEAAARRKRPPSTPTAAKSMLVGLLDRKGAPDTSTSGRVDGFVVNVGWADLQPTANGGIASGNAIDAAVAAIHSRSDLAGMRFKLRVMTGPQSPEWAKRLGGGPFGIQWDGANLTMPKFWTPEFGAAYASFMTKLAAKYDGTPELAQVEISRCMLTTAEPLLRGGSVPAVPKALVAAGYTSDLDDQCQHDEIRTHDIWKQTRSGLALNPYQRIDSTGWVTGDEPYTETIMDSCRSILGTRCVLENNSVRSPQQPDPYPQMYSAMTSMAAPIGFQTAAADRIGDEMQALQYAVGYGANSIELNRDYPNYDPTQLAKIRQQLHGSVSTPGKPGTGGHPGQNRHHHRNHTPTTASGVPEHSRNHRVGRLNHSPN
ncbi:MAG TPA: hypothetical protein VFA83_05000 [Acidimicrobiales bacterium]|nr:hypothetical protein [Acidimicrobiales bacterium]